MAFVLSHNEPPGSVLNPLPFTIDSLDPVEAELGGADITLHVYGTGFVDGMQIVFNGGLETTVFVSETELTTIVRPSTASAAIDVPVSVSAYGYVVEPPLTFSFTEPVEDPLPSDSALMAMTRAELDALAADRGLDSTMLATKADVIALLHANE
jgi:hypothetical protein